jgi:hypothetical protein
MFLTPSLSSYKGHRLCWYCYPLLRRAPAIVQSLRMGCQVMGGTLNCSFAITIAFIYNSKMQVVELVL